MISSGEELKRMKQIEIYFNREGLIKEIEAFEVQMFSLYEFGLAKEGRREKEATRLNRLFFVLACFGDRRSAPVSG